MKHRFSQVTDMRPQVVRERDHLLSAVGVLVIPTIPPRYFQLHGAIPDFDPDQPDYTWQTKT
jgi:hypothetical protein